jgi:hypothetical protein
MELILDKVNHGHATLFTKLEEIRRNQENANGAEEEEKKSNKQ